jgi:zona occludens toxin (predicted ATPase)
MITLITGTPGAGKTLYAVSKLLRELVGSTVKKTEPDGTVIDVPRRILTNINGLLLDHELIGPDSGGGLEDWHKWAKPGDVICYDEVQRSWTPRANGSKVPDYIAALETHRHMGVDFILLTQNPMLIDKNVTALVGRHLHVRRFGGIGAAIVYEWDHCSRSLLFSKSIAKHTFKYDKKVFQLYKSAELHTKPKTSVPTLAYVALLAVLGSAFLIPYAAGRIGEHSQKVDQALNPKGNQEHFQVAPPQPGTIPASLPGTNQENDIPPFNLESMTLAGSMSMGEKRSYFFQAAETGGALLQSDKLAKIGYKFDDVGGCMVKLTWQNTSRVFVCAQPESRNSKPPAFDPIPPGGRDITAPMRVTSPTAIQDGLAIKAMRERNS